MKSSKNMRYHFAINGRIYLNYTGKKTVAINDGVYRKVYNTLVIANDEKYRLKQCSEMVPVYQDRIDYLETLVSSATNIKNMFPFMYDQLVNYSAIE